MHSPRFSIVIPTRDRAVTLRSALRTCLDIDHPSFEVVVSDNDSSDDTAAVVAAFNDPRIRYVKTPTYLSMARNFENGLKHSRGEFLIFIGDDDGVLPFGLRVLEACFAQRPDIDVIDWVLNPFLWPHTPRAELNLNWVSNLRGHETETPEEAWRRINHPRSTDYNDLNGFNLYHGCVRRRVIDAATSAGVSLFACPIPDIGGGIRVLRFAQSKLRLDMAMTINGASQKSTGWAHVTPKPSAVQLQVRSDFKAKSFSEFLDSAVVRFPPSRAGSFFGSLIDEHMERRGDLTELDVRQWRKVYLEQLVQLTGEQLAQSLSGVNELFAWSQQIGASNADPLSENDVERHRSPANRLPRYHLLPFRFSEETLAAAAHAPDAPHRRIDDPRIVSIAQRADDIVVKAQSRGGQFTVHDYIQLIVSIARCDPFDAAKLIVDDSAVFRSKVVMNILGHLAAEAN